MNNNQDLELIRELSSGINEHQSAKLYKSEYMIDYEADFELSYSDIKSLTLALSVISEFFDVKAVVSARTSHIYGAALAPTLQEALTKVIDSNPIDVQNSVIASSEKIDIDFVKMLTSGNLAAAPAFAPNAIEYMKLHEIKFVIIKTPLSEYKKYTSDKITVTPFGTIKEEPNQKELSKDTFKVASKTKPTVEQIEDAVFAWKIAKYVKSNGVVISKGFKTNAIIQGVHSSAMELALDYSCDGSKDAVMAVDGYVTTHDIDVAAQGRIAVIILPFSTPDLIKICNKYNIVLLSTGFTNKLD